MTSGALRLIGVWLAVIVLLGVSVGTSYIPMGQFNSVVSVTIAFIQAFLVWTFFMRLRWSGVLVRLIAAVGLIWFLLLLGLSLTDYLTRHTVGS
ncbi:MAG TPA: cytochrome C oxidase subunit IV family protein [Steroidobacteraceae bacterium]|jgi:cytochrome c oxidase subunit 4|nr:cytochrome C oxidase subunit IV family protein [Steroidobacteraceae bacterium]